MHLQVMTVDQARSFQKHQFDGAILTKMDTDAKGELGYLWLCNREPIVLIGNGQEYENLNNLIQIGY